MYILFCLGISFMKCDAQTIQSDIPDSVLKKFECQKIYTVIDASRNKFIKIRGARKPLKYSEVYNSKVNPKYVKSGSIYMDGRAQMYKAILCNTPNRAEASHYYRNMVGIVENCLEGWVVETEPEEENQLYRFKAYEKEDMISGITVEVQFYREKGKFIVELVIQP